MRVYHTLQAPLRHVAASLLFLSLAWSCQPIEPVSWAGTYCYRWAESETDGVRTSEFLNGCDGSHEWLDVVEQNGSLAMRGAEGARPLKLTDPMTASAEGLLAGCEEPVVIRYTLHRQGQQVIVESAWEHEGQVHWRRRGYRQLED